MSLVTSLPNGFHCPMSLQLCVRGVRGREMGRVGKEEGEGEGKEEGGRKKRGREKRRGKGEEGDYLKLSPEWTWRETA